MDNFHTETDEETGVTLQIVSDDTGGDFTDPTESDEAIIMAVLHRSYINPAKKRGLTSVEAIAEFAQENEAEWEEFPLYMYDHSGTAYRVSRGGNPFSCPWDSGRVGSLFVKRSDVDDTSKAAELFCEVYTAWANGSIYGYIVEDADGEEVDSCWGFVEPDGAQGYVLEAGREAMKYAIKTAKEKKKREAKAIAAWAREFRMKPLREARA